MRNKNKTFEQNYRDKNKHHKKMDKLKLGWIGLGNMGNPMVKNLLDAGFEVTVHNRTKDKESQSIEAGASSANSPQELMESCDVVLTMLSNDAAVKEIFE
ncbi:MAG TPA: NAD(P)-binding domain-containing protein, partial [Flavobacterium sp.]